MVNVKLLHDFISLEFDELEQKYQDDDIDFLLDEIDGLAFNESHIIVEHTESFSDETVNPEELSSDISQTLDDRGFSRKYIEDYIKAAKQKSPSDVYIALIKQTLIGDSTKNIAPRFKFKNGNIRLKDLTDELDESEITMSSFTASEKESLTAQIKTYIKEVGKYEKGLQSILNAIQKYEPTTYSKHGKKLTDVTKISVDNKKEREALYVYYEDLYPKYKQMKEVMKKVLDGWDRVEGLLDEESPGFKDNPALSSPEYVEELDSELEMLFDIYKRMDNGLNYIMMTGRLKYTTDNVSATAAGRETNNIMINELNKILDIKTMEKLGTRYDKEFKYGDAGARQAVLDESSNMGVDLSNPSKDDFDEETGIARGDSLEEVSGDPQAVDMDSISLLDKVDPMFAIAAEKGLIKKKYSITSWQYIKDELESRIEDVGDNSPLRAIYESVLDAHNEYEDQAYDELDERNNFYIPLNGDAAKVLTDAGLDIRIDDIIDLHEDIITLISKILEVPQAPSILPNYSQADDFAPGGKEEKGKNIIPRGEKEKKKRDEMYSQFNLFQGREIGQIGERREKAQLGRFADALMELIKIADEYYGNPVRDLMIPYTTIPSFLNKNFLAPIINHGPESLGKVTFGIYRDWSVALITPSQLTALTEYLTYTQSTKRNAETLEKRANRVLKVLQDVAPNNAENDLSYFANQFRQLAEKDSTINLSDIELLGRPIKNIPYSKDKNETSYHQLLWLIHEFSNEFRSNRYTKDKIDDFNIAYENQRNKKTASAQDLVLNAHDEIRKMIGKPTYYNNCELDSFDNVSDTIDIMKEKYNIDLTCNDIVKMVEEVDSFESLAKRLGTNSEVIYHVKALYR